MARTAKLRIGDQPKPVLDKSYPLIIRDVRVRKAEVSLILEHASAELEGVQVEITRPVPLNPVGRVAQLLRAAGVAVHENTVVDRQHIVGRTVLTRFTRGLGGQVLVESFEPLDQEERHEPDA